MQSPVAPFLIRIWNPEGNNIAGAGFFVSERYILTCAHVVAAALGTISSTAKAKPREEIRFDFPLLSPNQFLHAKVEFWLPVLSTTGQPRADEDIALLKITAGTLPPNYRVPNITSSDIPSGTTFESFGFPPGKTNGVEAEGTTGYTIVYGCVPIENAKTTGYFIEPGFSGAPIYSKDSEAVIGMVVRADKEHSMAYMIPAQVLLQNCFVALTRLSNELVTTLLPQLEKIPDREWFPIYADCRPSAESWPPNIWMAVWHLFQLNEEQRGLNFVARLGQQLQRQELTDWVKPASQFLQVSTTELRRNKKAISLLFQVEPLAASPDQFHLYAWLWQGQQSEELTDPHQLPRDWPTIAGEIQATVAKLRPYVDPVVELTLPRDYFCCDITQWKMDEGEIFLRQLQVIFRCSKRFKERRQQLKMEKGGVSRLELLKQQLTAQKGILPVRLEDWKNKCLQLKEQRLAKALNSLYHLDAQHDVNDLNKDFRNGLGTFVAFGCKPDSNNEAAIFWRALDYGTPMVVWFREHPTGEIKTKQELITALSLDNQINLGELPRHIWELQDAALEKKDTRDVRYHLMILYDDYERVPEPK